MCSLRISIPDRGGIGNSKREFVLDPGIPGFRGHHTRSSCRPKQAGWRILHTPEPSVVHKVGRSTRQVKLRMVIESHDSLLRFYRKHYAATLRPHALWGVIALVQTGKWARVAGWRVRNAIGAVEAERGPAVGRSFPAP